MDYSLNVVWVESFLVCYQQKWQQKKQLCQIDCTCSPNRQSRREDVLFTFPGSILELKPKVDIIFREETAKLLKSKFMKILFKKA